MPICEDLLIDGYNLIHAVPDWKRTMNRDIDGARSLLAGWVRVIHDVDGVSTVLVFDGKRPELTVERPYEDGTFSFLFSPSGMTADTVIEQLVGKAGHPSKVVVASGDRLLQHTALSLGAQVMGIKELEGWVESCERRMRNYLK